MIDLNKAEEKLKTLVNAKRFTHSLNVRDEAVKLAQIYGADTEKAKIAGLLHDNAKDVPQDKALEICEQNKIELLDTEKANPQVLHAPVGAALLLPLFGVDDEEIKSAVRWHTLGSDSMTLLEKIIYIADIIEPTRTFEGVEILRKLAYISLDDTVIEAKRQIQEMLRRRENEKL